jgi:hypothetical protein
VIQGSVEPDTLSSVHLGYQRVLASRRIPSKVRRRHHRRPHLTIDQWNGKLVERQPHASQHHQDAAYDYIQNETAVRTTTNSNTQRHRPQAGRQTRVPGRTSEPISQSQLIFLHQRNMITRLRDFFSQKIPKSKYTYSLI